MGLLSCAERLVDACLCVCTSEAALKIMKVNVGQALQSSDKDDHITMSKTVHTHRDITTLIQVERHKQVSNDTNIVSAGGMYLIFMSHNVRIKQVHTDPG